MEPWDLPLVPKISPFLRLTVTNYLNIKECPLRGIWLANGVKRLLPMSPKAALGKVAHSLIEAASKGKISSVEDFDGFWDRYIRIAENDLCQYWNERHLIPLNSSVPRFELKKNMCKNAVEVALSSRSCSMALNSHPSANIESSKSRPKIGHEVLLSTKSGSIIGIADNIIAAGNQIRIIDYKAINFLKSNLNNSLEENIARYSTQLLLYASLYHSQYGAWPQSLALVTIGGGTIPIPFTFKEASDEMKSAQILLSRINCLIRKNLRSSVAVFMSELANPSPYICRYCHYRPLCTPYWEKRFNGSNEDWPIDLIGKLTKKGSWGKRHGFIEISLDGRKEEALIINLTPGRHPAIEHDNLRIAVFSLTRDKRNDRIYRENLFTTIYNLNKNGYM